MTKCLFLVEGPYDLQRLELLKVLFDEKKLEIVSLEGDQLKSKNYSTNFKSTIKKYLAKDSTHDLKEFDFLAQIGDTDGCFIDDSLVIENKSIKKIQYFRDHIEAKNVNAKLGENRNKRNNIKRFLNNGNIELYYNSCNIDDAYDGLLNPTEKQKGKLAINMYKKYLNNLKAFIDLIFMVDNSGTNNYADSWVFIQTSKNSLSSTSNLKYFLINHIDDLKPEYKLYVLEKMM